MVEARNVKELSKASASGEQMTGYLQQSTMLWQTQHQILAREEFVR